MKCESDENEYNIGQSWTTKDCFSCSCSGTGKYETLLSCYETNEDRPDIGAVAELRPVEFKNNFTTTCNRHQNNMGWLANQWWVKYVAPNWWLSFKNVDYVFEERTMGCCATVPTFTGVDARCEVITNMDECSSKVVLVGTDDQCPYPYGAIMK